MKNVIGHTEVMASREMCNMLNFILVLGKY
jgi:hypothetical protein